MKGDQTVIVLHEYGEPSHYRALERAIKEKYSGVRIRTIYREFSIFSGRDILHALIKKDAKFIKKLFLNIICLVSLAFGRKKIVILRIVPYDHHLLFLRLILKRHFVIYHTSWPFWDGLYYPRRTFAIDNYMKKIWAFFLANRINSVICTTQTALLQLKKNYNVGCEAFHIPHSYEERFFYPALRIKEFRKLQILYVGRLIPKKGLLRIFELIEKLPESDFEFTFVGKGPFSDRIKTLSGKYRNVRFLGYVDDRKSLADVFRESDILLVPSIQTSQWVELFGMVIIEAMACGCIVIGSNHTGPAELITPEKTGYLFDENEYVENTEKVLLYLHEDRGALNRMQGEAVERSKKFSEGAISGKWAEALVLYV